MDENWNNLISKYEEQIGKEVIDNEGYIHVFFGLVHGGDDYYYGLINKGFDKKLKLVSCVGSLEAAGYEVLT